MIGKIGSNPRHEDFHIFNKRSNNLIIFWLVIIEHLKTETPQVSNPTKLGALLLLELNSLDKTLEQTAFYFM